MTARDLYDIDTTFRLLVDEWVRERRCPLPLADRLLDFDLHAAAECAKWAATETGRYNYDRDGKRDEIGPYPIFTPPDYDDKWYWVSDNRSAPRERSYVIPFVNIGKIGHDTDRFDSVTDAILWLLDNWIPTAAGS